VKYVLFVMFAESVAREAAEVFATGDPFVHNGKASSWSVRARRDVLAELPGENIAR
jgi:hypothetical protein